MYKISFIYKRTADPWILPGGFVDLIHSPEPMVVGMIFHLRNFPRPLPPSHERLITLEAIPVDPLPDLHPVSLFFALWQDARLEASASKTSQPCRSPIPPTRHPCRRFFIRSLDDIPTFFDQAHERCDEQPHVESWNVEE